MTEKDFELLLGNAASELGEDYIDLPENAPPHDFPPGYKEKIIAAAGKIQKHKTIQFNRFVRGLAAAAALVVVSVGIITLVNSGLPSESNTTMPTNISSAAENEAPKNNASDEVSEKYDQTIQEDAAQNTVTDKSSQNSTKQQEGIGDDIESAVPANEPPATSSAGGMDITVCREGTYITLSEQQLEKLSELIRELMQQSALTFDIHTDSDIIQDNQSEGMVITVQMSEGQTIETNGTFSDINKLVLYLNGSKGYARVISEDADAFFDISAEDDLLKLIENALA